MYCQWINDSYYIPVSLVISWWIFMREIFLFNNNDKKRKRNKVYPVFINQVAFFNLNNM